MIPSCVLSEWNKCQWYLIRKKKVHFWSILHFFFLRIQRPIIKFSGLNKQWKACNMHHRIEQQLPLSVSSSFVHGLSISIQPLKALASSVRSTVPWGFPSWHTKWSDERLRYDGFLNDSGNSFSGHSQTLQSRNRHMPSSGQKGQSHHSLTWGREKYIRIIDNHTKNGRMATPNKLHHHLNQ